MTGFLTTHVLDTVSGCPGEGIEIALYRINAGETELLTEVVTNNDGRVDAPILKDDSFRAGTYELVFKVGDYYRAKGTQLAEPAFLDEVVLRFGIADETSHYHVPLLVSPYSYSTYRGS